MPAFGECPEDVIRVVLHHAGVREREALRATCRAMRSVRATPGAWLVVFVRDPRVVGALVRIRQWVRPAVGWRFWGESALGVRLATGTGPRGTDPPAPGPSRHLPAVVAGVASLCPRCRLVDAEPVAPLGCSVGTVLDIAHAASARLPGVRVFLPRSVFIPVAVLCAQPAPVVAAVESAAVWFGGGEAADCRDALGHFTGGLTGLRAVSVAMGDAPPVSEQLLTLPGAGGHTPELVLCRMWELGRLAPSLHSVVVVGRPDTAALLTAVVDSAATR